MSDERPTPISLVGILAAPEILSQDGAPPASPAAPGAGDDPGFDDGDVPAPEDTDWPLVRLCAGEPQNDIGNSRRLRHRHGMDLMHVQNIAWHVYDGRRWKEDIDGAGTRPRCHETVEAIALESYVIEPTEREAAEIEAGGAARERVGELRLAIRELDDKDLSATARKRETDDLRQQIKDLEAVSDRAAGALKAVASRRSTRRRFANTAGNKGKIDGLLSEAVAYLSHPVGDLDVDPLAFNVLNGTIRFREEEEPDPECPDPAASRMRKVWRAKLYPHDRADLISKVADVEFDKEAKAPTFEAFAERILPDRTVLDFVQRWFGYSITALTREQAFCLFHGEGANGKSTLVDLVARILGDYATSIPIDTLVSAGGGKKGSEATPDLARLPGARFVRTAEPKEGVAFDEALIKGLTSDEPIPVRRLNCEFVDVYPTFKLNASANRKPPIKGDDDGIWRRVNLVPFDVQIPKEERDKHLGDKLWRERSGVLNWLVAGCLDYLNRGRLDPPDVVTAATQEYREESDVLAPFLTGGIEVTKLPGDKVEAGKLYEAYVLYCRKNGSTPIQPATFNRRMPKAADRLGIQKGKSSVIVWSGLVIKAQFVPSDAPAFPRGS